MIRFKWNENKNTLNQKKHGISFEEAKTVFYDDDARLILDPDHSQKEERFILLGLSNKMRMLTVVHLYLENNDEIIRIISARKATRKETELYERRR